MDILISVKQKNSFEVGDLIYVNHRPDDIRLIVTDTDSNYAAFNPEKCQVTTDWYETVDLLLSGMSPVLLKKANQIALTEVIK